MGLIDIDVIAKGGEKDLALKTFQNELRNQAALAKVFGVAGEKKLVDNATSVFDMIDRIEPLLSSRQIRRLRIFGHGSDSTIQMGPFQYTGRRVQDIRGRQSIDQGDLDKVIKIIRTEVHEEDNVRTEYALLNEGYLKKLAGKFDSHGWVELHSCRIMGDDGKELLKALAKLWNVEVQASEDKQYSGGGLDGRVWIAKPWGTVAPRQLKAG